MPTPGALPPQILQRPMVSPAATVGGTVLPPSYGMFPQFSQLPQPAATAAMVNPASVAAAAAFQPQLTALPPRPAINPYYQPILYWYPSPPVSPQSAAYYVHAR